MIAEVFLSLIGSVIPCAACSREGSAAGCSGAHSPQRAIHNIQTDSFGPSAAVHWRLCGVFPCPWGCSVLQQRMGWLWCTGNCLKLVKLFMKSLSPKLVSSEGVKNSELDCQFGCLLLDELLQLKNLNTFRFGFSRATVGICLKYLWRS